MSLTAIIALVSAIVKLIPVVLPLVLELVDIIKKNFPKKEQAQAFAEMKQVVFEVAKSRDFTKLDALKAKFENAEFKV